MSPSHVRYNPSSVAPRRGGDAGHVSEPAGSRIHSGDAVIVSEVAINMRSSCTEGVDSLCFFDIMVYRLALFILRAYSASTPQVKQGGLSMEGSLLAVTFAPIQQVSLT